MSISQLRRFFSPTRVGILLFAGFVAGCGLVDEPPPHDETTASVDTSDATGAPLPLDDRRKQSLELTHKRVTRIFLDQPRFGSGRLVREYYPDADIVQAPTNVVSPFNTVGQAVPPAAKPPHASFQKRVADLRNSGEFGFHQDDSWEFSRVQLIGLAKHPQPVAFEADKAPDAKDVSEIPTRSLDAFELRGLAKLRAGENLYVEQHPGDKARVLGPIYAGASCVSCHQKTGELLGAFSYTFNTGKIAVQPAGGVAIPPPIPPMP